MSLFQDGWTKEEIFNKFDRGEPLSSSEAMAFLCAKFSNATNSNYDSEALFNRISTNFSVRITKEDSYD